MLNHSLSNDNCNKIVKKELNEALQLIAKLRQNNDSVQPLHHIQSLHSIGKQGSNSMGTMVEEGGG